MKTYEDMYGIGTDDTGRNRIKGPGVFEVAGVAQMGGRTPFRLSQLCEAMAGTDVEEMDIYLRWVTHGRVPHAVRELLCQEVYGYCNGEVGKDEL